MQEIIPLKFHISTLSHCSGCGYNTGHTYGRLSDACLDDCQIWKGNYFHTQGPPPSPMSLPVSECIQGA